MAALMVYQADLGTLATKIRKVRESGLVNLVWELENMTEDERKLLASIKVERGLCVSDMEMLQILAASKYEVDEYVKEKYTIYG